jgi:hypothetical protein
MATYDMREVVNKNASAFFAAHPSIKERIQWLQNLGRLRDGTT